MRRDLCVKQKEDFESYTGDTGKGRWGSAVKRRSSPDKEQVITPGRMVAHTGLMTTGRINVTVIQEPVVDVARP
jgi:hypothetical protein